MSLTADYALSWSDRQPTTRRTPAPIKDADGKVIAFIEAIKEADTRHQGATEAVRTLKRGLRSTDHAGPRGDFYTASYGVGMGGGGTGVSRHTG